MSDWYSTKTAKHFYVQHRTVQGGLFIAAGAVGEMPLPKRGIKKGSRKETVP